MGFSTVAVVQSHHFAAISKQNNSSWSRRYSLPLATTGCAQIPPDLRSRVLLSGSSNRPFSFHPVGDASTNTHSPFRCPKQYRCPSAAVIEPFSRALLSHTGSSASDLYSI